MSLLTTIVLAAYLANRAPAPRTGFVVDTTCCDIAPGGTQRFDRLTITLLALTFDSPGGNAPWPCTQEGGRSDHRNP